MSDTQATLSDQLHGFALELAAVLPAFNRFVFCSHSRLLWFSFSFSTVHINGGTPAAINAQVQPEEVKLSGSPQLDVFRFGDGVRYRLKNGQLPDEEEVKKLKLRGSADEALGNGQAGGNNRMPFITPLAGLLLMALGGSMLRTGSRKSSKDKNNEF